MSSLNEYLTKKYGATTQGELSKKKRKKVKSTPTADKLGSVEIIDEEDITGHWKNVRSEDDDDDEVPIFEIQQRSSKWKPIVDDMGDEAPQIVNASNDLLEYMTSVSSAIRRGDNQNSTELSDVQQPRLKRHKSSGLDVGLHSADNIYKNLERIKKDEKDLTNKMGPSLSGRDAAIIYRDNAGTKIDKAAKRAEERRKIEEEEKLLKWGKEEENRREEELRNKPLAIYKDDEDLNEELRAKDRWNDPAEMFLTKKKIKRRLETDQNIKDHQHRLIDLICNQDLDGMVLIDQMGLKDNILRNVMLELHSPMKHISGLWKICDNEFSNI